MDLGSIAVTGANGQVGRALVEAGPKWPPAALIDIMRKDSLGKGDAAAENLGITLTPVSAVWGDAG